MKYIINCDKRIYVDLNKPTEIGCLPSYVRLSGDVTEESARDFRRSLMHAESLALASGQEIIPVLIDSYGGDVTALFSMIDAIEACPLPIATIIEGKAMSAGAVLFSFGKEGHRYMGKNATLMLHEVSFGHKGKLEEIKSRTKHTDMINKKIFKMVAENCGQSKGHFLTEMEKRKNADWYLSADECKEHNLCNHIGIPTMETKITMSVKFGL
jgi:ATP-dependent Clp protease, protease subunit